MLKILLMFVGVVVVVGLEGRTVVKGPRGGNDDPLLIVTDSVSTLPLLATCLGKQVTFRVTGNLNEVNGSRRGIPCGDRVTRLVVDDVGVPQLLTLLKRLKKVKSIHVLNKKSRQTKPYKVNAQHVRDEYESPTTLVSKQTKLRRLKLTGLEKESPGFAVLDMMSGVESLVVDGCDLRGEGTPGRLRTFVKKSLGLESIRLSDVEVGGRSGSLQKIFAGLPRMESVKKLVLTVNGADMFGVDADLWGWLGLSFPRLEVISTNLNVNLDSLGRFSRLRQLRASVEPDIGTIDFSFAKGSFLESVHLRVLCKEPTVIRVLEGLRVFPKTLTQVKVTASSSCDLVVSNEWMRVAGTEFEFKDTGEYKVVLVERRGRERRH